MENTAVLSAAAAAASHAHAARLLFEGGYNCAQAVAGAFWREMGMPMAQALTLSAGFGGGYARLREVCGAVSGMVLVMNTALAREALDPAQKPEVYRQVQERVLAFETANGAYICRDLLALRAGQRDEPTPEARTPDYYAKRPCLRMIHSAVALTEEWLADRAASRPADTDAAALNADWYAAHKPGRPAAGHKGTFGKVLAAAGSEGYRGAAALCCAGALRAGAGLVQLASVPAVCDAVAAQLPEVMYTVLDADTDTENAARAAEAAKGATALLIGCGLGRSTHAAALVAALAAPRGLPTVVDADALALLAATPSPLLLAEEAPAPRVLTPHIGEMARLLGCTAAEVLADQVGAARTAAQSWGSVVVLKGSRTVIAAPDGRTLVLDAPCSGLAKGGSGDVLAGLIAGHLAQGMDAFDAAGCGVWLHSTAARAAAAEKGEAAMLPSDVLAHI